MWFDPDTVLAELEGRSGAMHAIRAIPAGPSSMSSTDSTQRAAVSALPPAPERQPCTILSACASRAPSSTKESEVDLLDRFEERAAIREHDGGQPRAEAEAAALAEVAQAAGMAPAALKRLWADHPDARAYLARLVQGGPATTGEAGTALGWGATRAWQAEARLRAAGLLRMGPLGRAHPITGRIP